MTDKGLNFFFAQNDEANSNQVKLFDSTIMTLFTDVFKGTGRNPMNGKKRGAEGPFVAALGSYGTGTDLAYAGLHQRRGFPRTPGVDGVVRQSHIQLNPQADARG